MEQQVLEERVSRLEQRVDRMTESLATRVFQFLEYYPFSLEGEGRDEGEIPCTRPVAPRHMPFTPTPLPEGEGLSRRTERPFLATREDIRVLREDNKILHDRFNSQNIFILTGFTVTVASVVFTRLLA